MRYKLYEHPDVVNRIDYLMTQEGWNDTKWGKIFGCDRKTIWSYRHGESSMPVAYLRKLCSVAKISADWILFGGDQGDGS